MPRSHIFLKGKWWIYFKACFAAEKMKQSGKANISVPYSLLIALLQTIILIARPKIFWFWPNRKMGKPKGGKITSPQVWIIGSLRLLIYTSMDSNQPQ